MSRASIFVVAATTATVIRKLTAMHKLAYVSVAPKLQTHPTWYAVPRLPLAPREHNDKIIAIAVTIGLAVLIAIGLPLAAVLPGKYMERLPVVAILPLYFHPDHGAWGPLYDA
jgi:hypothetical protein